MPVFDGYWSHLSVSARQTITHQTYLYPVKQMSIMPVTHPSGRLLAMVQTRYLSNSILIRPEGTDNQSQASLARLVWLDLTEWEEWRTWLPGVVQFSHIDEGSCGRGSRFHFYTNSSSQLWTIGHWEPERRLDFIVSDEKRKSVISIVLDENRDNGSLSIKLLAEYQFSGFQRLLSPFFLWRRARFLGNFLVALKQHNNRHFSE